MRKKTSVPLVVNKKLRPQTADYGRSWWMKPYLKVTVARSWMIFHSPPVLTRL
jgi:hypothetical protein